MHSQSQLFHHYCIHSAQSLYCLDLSEIWKTNILIFLLHTHIPPSKQNHLNHTLNFPSSNIEVKSKVLFNWPLRIWQFVAFKLLWYVGHMILVGQSIRLIHSSRKPVSVGVPCIKRDKWWKKYDQCRTYQQYTNWTVNTLPASGSQWNSICVANCCDLSFGHVAPSRYLSWGRGPLSVLTTRNEARA